METLVSTPEADILFGWYYRPRTDNYEFWWGNLVYIHVPAVMLEVMPSGLADEIQEAAARKRVLTD